MSAENVRKFYDALSRDSDLQQKIRALSQKHQGEVIDAANLNRLMEQEYLPLAAERGFSFTLDELREYVSEMQQGKTSGELPDEELDAVSGGIFCSGLGQEPGFCFLLGFDNSGGWCIWLGANWDQLKF